MKSNDRSVAPQIEQPKPMIKIRTTTPQVEVTPSIREDAALALSLFFPNRPDDAVASVRPVREQDGPYIVDAKSRWSCYVDPDDSQLVTLTYYDEEQFKGRERTFAEWIVANNSGWRIVDKETRGVVGVNIEFVLPGEFDEADMQTVTFEIPIKDVGVFINTRKVTGAVVTGYTTTGFAEIIAPNMSAWEGQER